MITGNEPGACSVLCGMERRCRDQVSLADESKSPFERVWTRVPPEKVCRVCAQSRKRATAKWRSFSGFRASFLYPMRNRFLAGFTP